MPYAKSRLNRRHTPNFTGSRFGSRRGHARRHMAARRPDGRGPFFPACIVLFSLYVLVLLRVVLLKHPLSMLWPLLAQWRPEDIGRHMNLTPFVTIRQFLDAQRYGYLNDSVVFQNLAGNLLAFLPWGLGLPVLMPRLRRWPHALAVSAAFILGIELTQLVTGFGIFDVDDILLNLAGAAAGFAMWRLAHRWRKQWGCVPAATAAAAAAAATTATSAAADTVSVSGVVPVSD